MSFIHVERPTNGHVITRFYKWHNYNYRFPDGCEVPLQVQYAWCHRCELFVEAEKLLTKQEIQQKIEGLSIKPDEWIQRTYEKLPEILEILQRRKKDGRSMLEIQIEERRQLCESWKTALGWFKKRKSTERCLECGSMTAIKVLPWLEEIPHPYDVGVIMLTGDGMIGGGPPCPPPPTYFDLEGNRLTVAEADSDKG